MPYRLLALDVDGTLLDPDGELRDTVRQAIMAAQQAGLRVILCTGRRFRSARPWAQKLQLDGPIVVHNGALVKDVASAETQHCHPLPETLCRRGLAVLRQLAPPLIYIESRCRAIAGSGGPANCKRPTQAMRTQRRRPEPTLRFERTAAPGVHWYHRNTKQ